MMTKKDKNDDDKKKSFMDIIDNSSLEAVIIWMRIHHAMKNYWIAALGGSTLMSIITVIFDLLVPMEGNILGFVRALLAIITGCFYFMLGYSISIYQSDSRRKHYDDDAPIDKVVAPYVSYRIRNSFRQRRRQSYPFIALILVIIISSAYSHLYTLFAGIALALIFAIVAYVRPTESETVLMVNNKMDPRDIMDIAEKIEYNESRNKKTPKKKSKRKNDHNTMGTI